MGKLLLPLVAHGRQLLDDGRRLRRAPEAKQRHGERLQNAIVHRAGGTRRDDLIRPFPFRRGTARVSAGRPDPGEERMRGAGDGDGPQVAASTANQVGGEPQAPARQL